MSDPLSTSEAENDDGTVEGYLVRLNGRAWGAAVGTLLAVGLFGATMILVLKGGPNVGQHLALLGEYLPGYRVTFAGACIGALYMFAIGYATARIACFVYNRTAS